MSQKLPFIKSFGHASDGLREAITDEPNFRFHVFVGLAVIILAAILHFSVERLAILILTIFFVISLELVNTIVEEIVNIVSPDFSPKAKLIKDLSASCVLILAFAAILIGILLFLPSILQLLFV